MASIHGALKSYLASLSDRRWKPGELDCGVFMADWVRHLCGRDPIADVRGTYTSEREFLRILRREGGFVESCEARLTRSGFSEAADATSGDIAVVLAPYALRRGLIQSRPTGSIVIDHARRAVITSDLGVVIAGDPQLPIVKLWRYRG